MPAEIKDGISDFDFQVPEPDRPLRILNAEQQYGRFEISRNIFTQNHCFPIRFSMRHVDAGPCGFVPGIQCEHDFSALPFDCGNADIPFDIDRNGQSFSRDLLRTDEACIEWHLRLRDEQDELWSIDLIHIRSGSLYDGFFERVAGRIREVLTPETRRAASRM